MDDKVHKGMGQLPEIPGDHLLHYLPAGAFLFLLLLLGIPTIK